MGVAAWCVWLCGCWTVLVAQAAEPPPPAEAVDMIEDPVRLEQLGEAALAEGDLPAADRAFGRMIDRMEAAAYLGLSSHAINETRTRITENHKPQPQPGGLWLERMREALLVERKGEMDDAADRYRALVREDPLKTLQVLRMLSVHPDRDDLFAEALKWVEHLVGEAKSGRTAPVYVTTEGVAKDLEVLTTEQVIAKARRRELIQYCYVEKLDFTTVPGPLPPSIKLDRCVVNDIYGPAVQFGQLVFRGIVLGNVDLGKVTKGRRNMDQSRPGAHFTDLFFRDVVFAGRANFAAVQVTEGHAYFPMSVFEQEADFRGAQFHAVTDFRFAAFGQGANFRLMRMYEPVYFGGARFRADTVFANVYSDRDVYFNQATFEGSASFERCEFLRGATFEGSRFVGAATFDATRVARTLNLSRVVFESTVNIKEMEMGALDALGTHFAGDASFMGATISGRARFSLDYVTPGSASGDVDALVGLYRVYQGDEDADEPITTQSSYGVLTLDDLSARIDADISFANTVFGGFTMFQGVQFGRADASTIASFFNTQFLGETHFERTNFLSVADFTTIFGKEVAFNNATFHRSLVFDDAAVSGRVTLTDAVFEEPSDLSLYAAEITSLQIDLSQVKGHGEPHRLFYERCAHGDVDRTDIRISRIAGSADLSDGELRDLCYGFLLDELTALKESYSERAMGAAEDHAYWWARHHAVMQAIQFGSLGERVEGVVRLVLFEWCFGWGVRLQNLGFTAALITVLYAMLYRLVCPDTVLQYNGASLRVREVPFLGLCYVSLQAMIAVNTGWDFGEDDHRFRVLNVSQTVLGFIVLTFFVGAYTRMILA